MSATPVVGTDIMRVEEDDELMDTDASLHSQPTDRPPDPPASTRKRHAGHVIAIVVGCLMLLPGLGMMVGGGAAASAQAFATDDGYFHFTPDRVGSEGVAVVATDLWFDDHPDDDAPDWLLDTLDVDLRLRVDGATPSDEVFVGIARAQDVERYLEGASYSEVADIDRRAVRYDEIDGISSIGRPGAQEFWAVSASGDGEQELTWDASGGRWSVVVMNADGSPTVAADIEIGVHSGAVMPVAIVILIVGALFLLGAVILIIIGVRGRRVPGVGEPGQPSDPFPPPEPTDAVRLDDDQLTPVG